MGSCGGPYWVTDDLTACFRHRYLQEYLLGLTAAVSATIVTRSVLKSIKKRKIAADPARQPLLGRTAEEGESEGDGYMEQDNHRYTYATVTYDSVMQEGHKKQNLPSPASSLMDDDNLIPDERTDIIITHVIRPTSDRVKIVLEWIATAAQLVLAIAALTVDSIRGEWSESSWTPAILGAFWTYIFVLSTIRLCYINSPSSSFGGLWYHATALYPVAWISALISFRSALLHPFSPASRSYYIANLVLNMVLVYCVYSSKTGNKPARLYVSPGHQPNNERISSIFSLFTFSFMDPLIWQGYWEHITAKDIWDLNEVDHAFHVLRRFRKVKTTVTFTWKVINYFKKPLSVGGLYATIFAVTIFGPAIFVKLILDYVENPSKATPEVAWLYVVGILAFSVVKSVTNGQALFIGRRACVQIKAIIIGEVYAKALRRKAAAASGSLARKENKKEDDDSKNDDETDGEEKKDDSQANLGAIINLMAIDAYKVSELFPGLHYFVSGILQIIIAFFLLYGILGWSAFVGGCGMIAVMPINYWFSRKFASFQDRLMAVTDRRVEKTNEVLQAIRIIKYFAWEQKFADSVLSIREEELAVLRARYMFWAAGAALFFGAPVVITCLSFCSYTMIQGEVLTAPVAFTSLALFNIMRGPMDQLAFLLSGVLQAKVSLDRVIQFLSEGETDKYNQLSSSTPRGPNSPKIGFENASFSWLSASHAQRDSESFNFRLRDLNADFPVGKMSVIVGPTGSGKTSLLMALLGEMDRESGNVFLPGAGSREDFKPDPATGLCDTVAYCAQQAWLLNDTLRNNILFSSDYDEARYNAVIDACNLRRDLEILDAGDQTEVGEKGVTLSGGQKQRISLARAVYSRAKHLILDDCLSAVDSHTALSIYENCLAGPILENRTVILVSHNVALTITQADKIFVMENGRIKAQGSPAEVVATGALGDDELVKQGASASQTASQGVSRSSSAVNLSENHKDTSLGKKLFDKKLADALEGEAIENSKRVGSSSSSSDDEQKPAEQGDRAKSDGKLIQEEALARGFVDRKIYAQYLLAMGKYGFWFTLLSFFVMQQVSNVGQSWWIREWTVKGMIEKTVASDLFTVSTASSHHAETYLSTATGFLTTAWQEYTYKPSLTAAATADAPGAPAHPPMYYLIVYFSIGLGNVCAATLKEFTVFFGGLHASRVLFNRLLSSVLGAKTRFFDSTPVGRIMNRFSKDIEGIDQDLSPVASDMAHCMVTVLTTAALIAYITPGFLIMGVVILILYYVVSDLYLTSSRELKRLDSVSRSPIFQHFGETLVGVSTIRAYGDQRRFVRDNMRKIDDNHRPYVYMWNCNRWLYFRVDTIGALVASGAAAFIMLNLNNLDSGLAGLSLSYALMFNEVVLWAVRLYAELEMNMNSVERVQEYLDLDSEAPAVIEDSRPPANWPSKGEIVFENLSLRYAPELPLVIKNANFTVPSFNKVGVVGRTGAGKSTIITALFRFLEADNGRVIIDGLDISTIGLRDLREGLAIIPQDPTLFVGTIRSNLDPFGLYTDEAIFRALRRVHLIQEIPSANGIASSSTSTSSGENANQFLNLENKVTEGGGNLSQGQRQLVCLARALLKSPKILLLDEATASIDYDTDARIQSTIREEFVDTTILTVAHRLRSIADYNLVLVMDRGEVVEYDSPYTLIHKEDGIFRDMCLKSGEFEALESIAKKAYDARKTL
ncbi:ATP-dependent bile acid permease [Trichomonascus vanleenenianus]|uniref:ATP-dependent bile acid permease n=1 Tax=Trichomonascus vanleenenianus TaxID=2268995 RepID=UPI003ECAF038